MNDLKTFFIAVEVQNLNLKTDINTQKSFLSIEDDSEYELQDLTIDELFTKFNPNAGFIRLKNGVEWKVFPVYQRNMTNVNVVVSWIASDLKFYEFDKIEEGDYEV